MTDSSSSNPQPPSAVDSAEELLVRIPSAIVHLVDKEQSIELAYGNLELILLRQNDAAVAVLARIGDQIQWPITKDEAIVKLDDSHYFFTLNTEDGILNYGLTIPSKGQEALLEEFDAVLDKYSGFSEQRVAGAEGVGWWVAAKEAAPEELERDEGRREKVEESSAAYWTTLAPNVEEYSGRVARMIAAGSGQVIRGILWCGDVTAERLKWGNDFLRRRLGKRENAQVSPQCFQRIARVKKMTKMSEDVATGILSGVIKVSETITGTVVNSKVGKKFFNMLPGEIILASLDGFNKVCDAVEVAGKKVMSTSSESTTELMREKYGEEAGKATNQGLEAAGHALGTAWAVFKLRKALNPKRVVKPTTLVKAAASASKPKSST